MHIKTAGAALGLALLSTTTALAADLPSRRAPPVYAPPPPIPVFTWTGFYVGAHAGYEFGRSNGVSRLNASGAGLAANGSSPSGFIGGGHVGYLFSTQSLPFLNGFGNNLFGGGLVAGVEGDVDGSTYRSNYLLGALNNSTSQNIQGSVRGRLGIAVDRVLFYATGGAAFGGLRNNYTSAVGFDSISRTRVGYTVGGGVEYAFANNWSARVEYRYTDFGSFNDNLVNSTGGAVNVRHRETDNRVQAGISYHFNTPALAPVVARY